MVMANTEPLGRVVEFLKRTRDAEVSLSDVVALAEITAEALQTFFATMDTAVYRELREIAEYIQETKLEIGALQVNELKETHIPAAGHELDAIVRATEAATHTIMECAEKLMGADASDPRAYKALVDEQMVIVFEACSFQDITGQRIGKVVETLQNIEARVSRFATAMRAKDAGGPVNEFERKRAERRERLMLNGPQLAGEGNGQVEVDTLLNSPAKSAQSDIDRLFR